MKLASAVFYSIEMGRAQLLVRLIPLTITVLAIITLYNTKIYKGLGDADSMDNAQLARQIIRKEGFNTFVIRPYALMQVSAFKARHGQEELFPSTLYSGDNIPRIIPDTYHSPGYPLVLGGLFVLAHTDFDEPHTTTSSHHIFSGDRWIPPLNQIFLLLTAGVVFLLGYRLFDDRVAWMSAVAFLASDFVWKLSLLAAPINLLMLLITILLFITVEICRICENRFEEPQMSLGWAWLLVPVLAVWIGITGLVCLPLLVLLLPVVVYLMLMRRTNWFFPFILVGIAGLMAAPWFYHWYRSCGNPLGSNLTLGLLGQGDYTGNQIYLATSIPSYTDLFKNAGTKEYSGFLWYFQRGWDLLGSNPMVLLFAVSILHEFRRRRVHNFRWLVVGCSFAIIAITNLANAHPDPVGSWNLLAIMLPSMILIGSAFFFVMLDRMTTQLPLLRATLVVAALVLSVTPMLLVFTTPNYSYYNLPTYIPPYLSYISRLAPAGQWITTDIPWATAWYGDRPSLWLPDTISDFEHIYDDICPTSLMLVTPETLSKPMLNLTSGEQKEWLPIIMHVTDNIPEGFPLHGYTKLPPGGPEYIILSQHMQNK